MNTLSLGHIARLKCKRFLLERTKKHNVDGETDTYWTQEDEKPVK